LISRGSCYVNIGRDRSSRITAVLKMAVRGGWSVAVAKININSGKIDSVDI
jgi:hypothetical protein